MNADMVLKFCVTMLPSAPLYDLSSKNKKIKIGWSLLKWVNCLNTKPD